MTGQLFIGFRKPILWFFIKSDVRFSLTSYFRSKRGKPRALKDGSLSQLASSASVRLLQIQLCLIYAYTGLEKMKGPTWWDGTAVWTVLGNRQLFSFDISWVRNAPLLIALMTFGTVFFEIYFAALVWIPKVRKWILSLGVMMHTGIALSMGLFYFSLGMISTYFVFLKPAFLEMVFGKMKISKAWLGDAD
ncbi:MAG: hypothetical protein EOP05_22265 [Proteobacteria bacterium]|nr:MAG: hypothetical protein EOP05_22265 [Pseudomonadota bacterium]